jgi:Ser/Thr protein kinase RdoA (MazF antagonist)
MISVWATLTEENILNLVEKTLGLRLNNLCLKRNSYINRVYELENAEDSKRFIVKFYRPGRWSQAMILEEHQFLLKLSQEDIPVILPMVMNGTTLFKHAEFNFAVFPKMGGRAFDEFDESTWQQLGRLFARIHLTGQTMEQSTRVIWTPAIATQQHLETIQRNNVLPEEFKMPFTKLVERFIKHAQSRFEDQPLKLIHGDAHKGNLIHRPGEGLYILDFDDICQGVAVQDLWMFLPDVPEKCASEIEWFLEGYEQFKEFDRDQLALIPYLRGMRLIHFAAWCALQSAEADFAEHFPEWGSARYWRDIMVDLEAIMNPNY